jgi:hypothetical protein
MSSDHPQKFLPVSVVALAKTFAPTTKEVLRKRLPPLFHILKSAFALIEGIEVEKALRTTASLAETPLERLRDPIFLEQFIISVGLHASSRLQLQDGWQQEWPTSLEAFIGKGLQVWQYPTQFSKYLAFLSQFQIKSHLEIGISYGGAFVFSVEYLNRFYPELASYCIDVVPPSALISHYARRKKFTYITAKSSELFRHIDPATHFDLVFVDGDHSKEGVMSDFEMIKDRADIIAFHDIVNYLTPGAVEAWQIVKSQYSEGYDFFEFIDQYPDVLSRHQGNTLLGIGVMVKKELQAKLLPGMEKASPAG